MTHPEPSRTDEQLVRRAAEGGRQGRRAFDTLAHRHLAWLVRTVDYLLGNRSDAEDVAQDALVRAYSAISRCPPDGFQAWLRVIATRLAYNHSRASGIRQGYYDRLRDVTGDAIDEAASYDDGDLIEAILGTLPYPYREILVLRHVEEMPVADIAKMLAIGVSAAKMRLLRARREFKREYDLQQGRATPPARDHRAKKKPP